MACFGLPVINRNIATGNKLLSMGPGELRAFLVNILIKTSLRLINYETISFVHPSASRLEQSEGRSKRIE